MEEILLIRADTDHYLHMPKCNIPLGLLYLSAYLKKHGYNVKVLDLNKQPMPEKIDAKIVGFTMLSYMRSPTYELIRKIKGNNPDTKIVVGGVHASAIPEVLINNLPIDAVVVGEGETAIKELADYWIKGVGDFNRIKCCDLIKNLDEIPFPDYEQIDFDWYRAPIQDSHYDYVVNGMKIGELRYANIVTSRGCMGRCKFCNAFKHWGNRIRFRSAKNVLDEILLLYNKFNVRFFNFNDDCFGQNKKIAKEICRGIIDSGIKIAFYTSMRANCVEEELIKLMKEAGCFMISYGVESGSEKVLENINKNITKEDITKAITLTKKYGIKSYALLMVGNLGETDETIQETVDLMTKLEVDICTFVGRVFVYPDTIYSKLMDIPDEFWIDGPDDLPTFNYGFTQQDLNRWNCMMHRIPNRW